jgi:DNA repair exonuclease SbcCD nuclease subunit
LRFIHAADIHLDSPLTGLATRAGERATTLVGATRRAFEALIAFAIEQAVDFVIIAGDLYDGDWRDFATGLAFTAGMARLERAGIRVVMVRGNHDAENTMTRRLTLPANVHVFESRKAHVIPFDDVQVAFHGRSFGTRREDENLALTYPAPLAGFFNIGVLHTSANGRPGHDVYAPCSVDDLKARGYDYWALGHVHKREVLCDAPWIVFPGNLQGRDANETGAKGCTLVTVEGWRVVSVEAVALDVVRWARCRVEVADCADLEAVGEAVRGVLADAVADADGRPLAVRLTLTGASPVHRRLVDDTDHTAAECEAAAQRAGDVWIEKVEVRTTDPEPPGHGASDALGELIRAVEAVQADDREALLRQLVTRLEKLPPEIREAAGLSNLIDGDPTGAVLAGVLADAEALLLNRLLGAPEDRS